MKCLGMMMAAVLLFFAASANAQVKQGSQEAGVTVGAGVPMSNTTLGGNIPSTTIGATGPAFGVNYDYMIRSNISIGGDFAFRSFGDNNVSGGTVSATDWTLMATGKYQFRPDDRLRPYGLLGLGFGGATPKLSAGSIGGSQNGSGFAYAIGAGAEYDINSLWSVGAELRWTGLSVSLNNGYGSQSVNSLDLLVSGRYKFGS